MSFLAPLFLAGLAAIAAPIIAHLIRRSTRDRFAFSSLHFLEESPPRLDRKRRIQHPALLALRALIIALLVLAFCRPFFNRPENAAPAARVPQHQIVLLDASASMQRAGLWDSAIEHILSTVAQLHPADHLTVLTFGTQTQTVLATSPNGAGSANERLAQTRAALQTQRPGWTSAHLDRAVERALEVWEEMAEVSGGVGQRELVILSDFAEGMHTAGLATVAWPEGARVSTVPLQAATSGNASLEWLGWTSLPNGRRGARVRVARSFDVDSRLQWTWTGPNGERLAEQLPSLDLLPGSNETFTLPWPDSQPAAVRLDITGDAASFDNRLWLVPPAERAVALEWFGAGDSQTPGHARFFLTRAAAGIPEPRLEQSTETQPGAAGSVVIVDGVVSGSELNQVREAVQRGAVAVVLPPPDAALADWVAALRVLTGDTGWNGLGSRQDARLGEIDFASPQFSPFSDPRFSDFSRIRFWTTMAIEPPAASRVVARFDDGAAAVIEQNVGAGLLIVWAGGWSRDQSQFALSSKFVPWLQTLAERAAGGPRAAAMVEVDAHATTTAAETEWTRVDAPLEARSPDADARPSPGLYTAGAGDRRRWLGINVPAGESRLQPLPAELWDQLGVPVHARATTQSVPDGTYAAATVLESNQSWWRLLLWSVLALLAVESGFAFALSRRSRSLPPDAAPATSS